MPPVIVGEQVASPAGLGWLDAVFADLEGAGYACAAADMCAAGVGAPHLRQRLYFVAVARGEQLEGLRLRLLAGQSRQAMSQTGAGSGALAHADEPHPLHGKQPRSWRLMQPAPHATDGFWSPADWIPCSDGKARPAEPGTFPLAYGATARVGRLRAYGNAIVRPQAQAFLEVVIDMLTATTAPTQQLTRAGTL
jgi:DNA (cytosine-5)-methyltransferase 1